MQIQFKSHSHRRFSAVLAAMQRPIGPTAGNFHVSAIAKIAAPALETSAVVATVPADADPLPFLPLGYTFTQ